MDRNDHQHGHARPPTRRDSTSRTSDDHPRFFTQLHLHQRATLRPQGTLRTLTTNPKHIRTTKAQCQGTKAQRRGAQAVLAHGTDVSERSGKRAQIAIRYEFGPGSSFNHSPHTISQHNRLLRNCTASPQATGGLAPLHRSAPGKVSDFGLGGGGARRCRGCEYARFLCRYLKPAAAPGCRAQTPAQPCRRPHAASPRACSRVLLCMSPGSNVTGGRVIGHDERFSHVLDTTVAASVSCTPKPSYPLANVW